MHLRRFLRHVLTLAHAASALYASEQINDLIPFDDLAERFSSPSQAAGLQLSIVGSSYAFGLNCGHLII